MKVKDLMKIASGNKVEIEDEAGNKYYNISGIRDCEVLEIEARSDIVMFSPLIGREETFTGLRIIIKKKEEI